MHCDVGVSQSGEFRLPLARWLMQHFCYINVPQQGRTLITLDRDTQDRL
jgi:hypothetical protein